MSSLGRRVYGPLVWSLAMLLVTGGAALLILMWTAVIGPFHFGVSSDGAAGSSFGLWIPGRDESASWRVRAWRGIAPRDRPLVESAARAELARLGVGSIAVPDARGLTRAQAVELRSFLDGGRGAIVRHCARQEARAVRAYLNALIGTFSVMLPCPSWGISPARMLT